MKKNERLHEFMRLTFSYRCIDMKILMNNYYKKYIYIINIYKITKIYIHI